ncbi:MAG: hypothetical protein MI757_15465 [Pirellulales bacterium]|nr:hypothetical protein [Pirellulales bacterium]
MKHPFAGIVDTEIELEIESAEADEKTRREVLHSAVGLGVGAVALGATQVSLAQVTTQALGEEGTAKPPTVTTFAVGEEGSRPPAVTKAGPGHPEHAGQKIRNAMRDLVKATASMAKGDWAGAAGQLNGIRKSPPPKDDKFGHSKRLQQRREALEKKLKKMIASALDKADKQAKAEKLVPALLTYRKADQLDPHYGFDKRVDEALKEITKHKDYRVALKKVEKIEADAKKPKPTTLAIGEEGGPSVGRPTRARREEGREPLPPGADPRPTTDAIGEEG